MRIKCHFESVLTMRNTHFVRNKTHNSSERDYHMESWYYTIKFIHPEKSRQSVLCYIMQCSTLLVFHRDNQDTTKKYEMPVQLHFLILNQLWAMNSWIAWNNLDIDCFTLSLTSYDLELKWPWPKYERKCKHYIRIDLVRVRHTLIRL